MLNYSKMFDLLRNVYGKISYFLNSGKALPPLRYSFELTYRCNLRCPYCYVGDDRLKKELTTEEWFSVIRQVPFYSFITLVGGEPLLRKDFIDILRYSSKKTFGKTHVVTNATLLNEEFIDEFIKNKMLLLSVSLDGYKGTHDKNRKQEGIFDKIISNLDFLQKQKSKYRVKRPMIDIKTLVLENNLDDLPKLYKMANEMKFDFFSISFLRSNYLKQNSVLRQEFSPEFYEQQYQIIPYFDLEHFSEIYKEIISISKKSNVKIRFAPKFDEKNELENIIKFFTQGKNKPVYELYKPCLYPFSNMIINPEGDVYPCLSLNIGNIKNQKLNDIYNLPKFRCFRKNLKVSKTFTSCQMCCELFVN